MACVTCYLTVDHLGSTRLMTDQNGNVVARHDFLPFGEELTTSNRTPALKYGTTDFLNQKFTGKERDSETGLDYFGARYFSSAQGRWTSPDWSPNPQPVPYADLTDPQTLNLYAYVRNNPLSIRDFSGHGWWKDFWNGLADSTYRPLVTLVKHPIITGETWAVRLLILSLPQTRSRTGLSQPRLAPFTETGRR
jgi:RHS repeat-associated protein